MTRPLPSPRLGPALRAALLLLAALLPLTAPPAAAGPQETLGIVSFTPPPGWIREGGAGAVAFRKVDEAGQAWCTLTVFGSRPTRGRLADDFAAVWRRLALNPGGAHKTEEAWGLPPSAPASLVEPVEVKEGQGPGGSRMRWGVAAFNVNGSVAEAMLQTCLLGGQTFSLLYLSNDMEPFIEPLTAFEASLRLTPGP